jgi:hypothetical protein
MSKTSCKAYCDRGIALALANASFEKPCCTEKLSDTKIFGYPFWKKEEDADILARITVYELNAGLTVGKDGALKWDSTHMAAHWSNPKGWAREDEKMHPLLIAGKRVSRYEFPDAIECNIYFEVFDGCDGRAKREAGGILEKIKTKSQEIGSLSDEIVNLDIGEKPCVALKRIREERKKLENQLLAKIDDDS